MSTNSSAAPPRLPLLAAITERQRLALAAALTALAYAAAIALVITQLGHARGPGLNLAVLMCLPAISFGRRWPLPVLALASVAAAAQMATGTASLLLGLVLGAAGYTVAVGLPRRLSIRAVLAAAAIFGAALLYAGMTYGHAPVTAGAVMGFLPLAAGWFIGDSVAARRRYVAGLAEQAERERAAEAERARQEVREERVRIARELHDVVAHTLAVITVQAGVGRRLMAKRPEEAGAALESIEMIGRTAQDELRVVLGLLRDEDAGAAALAPAPKLVDLKELVDTVRASGTPVELRTIGHRSAALPGARAHALPGRPGGAHQRRQACAAGPGNGRPHGLRRAGPARGGRRRGIRRADGGRSGTARHSGHGPRDRRDAGADRRFRRLARGRTARPRLPRARRGPDRGRDVSDARAAGGEANQAAP